MNIVTKRALGSMSVAKGERARTCEKESERGGREHGIEVRERRRMAVYRLTAAATAALLPEPERPNVSLDIF